MKKHKSRSKKKQPRRQKVQSPKKEASPQDEQQPRQRKIPEKDRPQSTGKRLWLFRFIAVCIPFLTLIGVEMGLRVIDYGVPTGFTFDQKIDGEEKILSNP